jgi:uncharacterized surface protein with fasciclin (FAS1) repeats
MKIENFTHTRGLQVFKKCFSFFLLLLLFISCEKKEFEKFYERPAGLAQPIYQELQAKGHFTSFLACIDKAGYKDILGKAGYWTIFAPNDEAFKRYFAQHGIGGVAAMDVLTAQKIVKYSLIYNAFKSDKLGDYQSGLGWVPGMAFKRRTAYYEGVQKEIINGEERLVISSNRNNRLGNDYYHAGDNNNKYIPYFLDKFLTPKGLSRADYNYFYPDVNFTGFNVGGAEVSAANMVAQNGIIHEVNQVLEPLPNIDQHLASADRYSTFKAIFDKYMVSYVVNAAATEKNNQITGANKEVYVKVFDQGLAYSPNNENYAKLEDNDGQREGYTLFAPTNEALANYLNNTLLEHYKTLDALPKAILYDFLNAHMWNATVWPTKFANTPNSFGQGALFDPVADVVDKKVLSNGIFYGTNKVQEANVFSSVFGQTYLNPNFSLMTRALTTSLKPILINNNLKFTLFLVSDEVLTAAGFTYDLNANTWRHTPPGGGAATSGSTAWGKLNRILNTHVVMGDSPDLSGSGILESYEGEYIGFEQNKVYSAGNREAKTVAEASNRKTTANGSVYVLDKLLVEPQQSVGLHLAELAKTPGSPFKKFFDYLNNSTIYTKATGAILGITAGSSYTLLVPDNAAMDEAIAQGYLPASNNPSATADKEKVANFIRYHLLDKATVVPDGKKDGGFVTLLQKDNGEPTTVNIANAAGTLTITDMLRNATTLNLANSNNLSNRTVIHLLTGFLKFTTSN